MVGKNIKFAILLGFFILAIACFSTLLSAAVVVVSPANFTNQSGSIMINITYGNVSDITSPVAANTTFYYNNTLITVSNFACVTNTSCNATWNTATVADNRSAVFSVILGNDTLLKVSDANSSNVMVDNTRPVVFPQNITSPLANSNKSGTLIFNISVIDTLAGIRAVLFNITNSTGIQNATYMGTREGSTDRYSVSVNTAHFPEGLYNLTVYVNDSTTSGNVNGSARILAFRFDNLAPSINSFSCTPNPVTESSTTTCSCSANDTANGSGVNQTTFTTNPSTATTGSQTTSCTAYDYAGNSISSSYEYNVSSSSSGASSGSGGGGVSTASGPWAKTVSLSDTELSSKGSVNASLKVRERVAIKVGGEVHHIGVITLSSSAKVTINVSSNPQQADILINETKKFDLGTDSFYDIAVKLDEIKFGQAKFTIMYIHEEYARPVTVNSTTGSGGLNSTNGTGSVGRIVRSKTAAIIGIIVLLLAIGIGGGAWAYYKYHKPPMRSSINFS